jgi:hypothetical protein
MPLSSTAQSQLFAILSSNNPLDIRKLACIEDGHVPVGKMILLKSDWHGYIDLDARAQYKHLANYLRLK